MAGSNLEGKIMVLEEFKKETKSNIEDIYGKVTALQICANGWSDIKTDLTEIKKDLKQLNTCNTQNEGRKGLWNDNKVWIQQWITTIITIGIFLIWESYKHTLGVKP